MISTKAQRGVTLDVFDGAIVFAYSELNVGDSDIVLKIDEGFVIRGNVKMAWVGEGVVSKVLSEIPLTSAVY